jgi:hypothetical protein
LNTMNAALPPSSTETFFTVSAHFLNNNWKKRREDW